MEHRPHFEPHGERNFLHPMSNQQRPDGVGRKPKEPVGPAHRILVPSRTTAISSFSCTASQTGRVAKLRPITTVFFVICGSAAVPTSGPVTSIRRVAFKVPSSCAASSLDARQRSNRRIIPWPATPKGGTPADPECGNHEIKQNVTPADIGDSDEFGGPACPCNVGTPDIQNSVNADRAQSSG